MQRYIEKFLRYLEIEKNYSSLTLLNYRGDLEDFNNFLNPAAALSRAGVSNAVKETPPEEVDYLSLRRYLAHLKQRNLKSRSIARRLSCLRSFFKFLCRDGYLKANPTLSLSTLRLDKHLPLFLTEQEMLKLLRGLSHERAFLRLTLEKKCK